MSTLTHTDVVDYFKNLQENMVGLNDFFRMDLSEIKGAFRSSAEFPCLVIESPDGDLSKSNPAQLVDNQNFAFTVYYNPEHGDYDDQNAKVSLSKEMGLKIIARMKLDAVTQGNVLFNKFRAEEVRYHKVGPVFTEKLYGYRFVGGFTDQPNLQVDPEDWVDIN